MRDHAYGLPPQSAARWNCCVDDELRRELLARRDEDQRIRHLVSSRLDGYMIRLPEELAEEWQRIDKENTRWLAEVLSARGWPGQALVGEDGTGAAWLLAQHADHDPVRQRAFLHALRSAAAQGQASRAHLAYLEDRVRVNADQPQLYGLPRLRTGNGWTSAAPKPDLNRSLTMKRECETSHSHPRRQRTRASSARIGS